MSPPGEALHRAIQARVMQVHVVRLAGVPDWEKMTVKVEWLASPGVFSMGRILCIGGSGGVLVPGVAVGDLALALVAGHDLEQMLRTKTAHRPFNPFFYDMSDAIVIPGLLAGTHRGVSTEEPAGRIITTTPTAGKWLLKAADGSELRQGSDGNWTFKLGPTGNLYLGGQTNARPVLRDGDSNAAGGVSASQSRVLVGDP